MIPFFSSSLSNSTVLKKKIHNNKRTLESSANITNCPLEIIRETEFKIIKNSRHRNFSRKTVFMDLF